MSRAPATLLVPLLLGAPAAGVSQPEAAAPATPSPLTLWYDEPAKDWESQSLPIGSGALGASIFGGVAEERIPFNEKSLWTGGPGSPEGYAYGNWPAPRPGALGEVRERIAAEGRADPPWVASALGQPKRGYGAYQSFGEVKLAFPELPGDAAGYRRELDLSSAVAGVSFTAGGVRYRREYFASAVDGVIVARLEADRPGRIGLIVSISTAPNRSAGIDARGGRVILAGRLDDNGLRFEAQLQVLHEGGDRLDGDDGSVTVRGADSVTLLLAAGTDYAGEYPTYRGRDPHASVTARLEAAASRPYAALRADHAADHGRLFGRVVLDVGQRTPAVTTRRLLESYREAATPEARRALEVLLFQYGRYLLIASSRPGSLPANLQGVWNVSTTPPWSADYHVNINLQMNYWAAETANLPETLVPFFDYVEGLVAPGRVTATEMFGSRGWVLHNETTPFGFTGVHDWPTAFWFPEAAAWLAQHFYEHYRFHRDEGFLRERAYPLMKPLTEFWLDELQTDRRDGTLVVTPSFSPEHGDFSAGASMSQQIVWDLLTNVAEAAAILGDETGFRSEVARALERLDPGTRIGSWGQLQEWKEDRDDPENQHRHVSHLFGLHPGRQLSPRATPELAEAARVILGARGDGGTGWSKAWKICFWARLLDGDHAHLVLSELLENSTLNNLWDTHPPFQIDGNFGATAGIVEMLLQSQGDAIDVLPALPDAWPEGSVSGLRARGDVTVGAEWSEGRATRITLDAGRDGPLRVGSDLFGGRFRVVDAASGEDVAVVRDGRAIRLEAAGGRRYVATALPPGDRDGTAGN